MHAGSLIPKPADAKAENADDDVLLPLVEKAACSGFPDWQTPDDLPYTKAGNLQIDGRTSYNCIVYLADKSP